MVKQFLAAVVVFGYLGSVNAQEEGAQPAPGVVQIKKEVKGKQAVPERGNEANARAGVAITTSLPAGNPMLTVGQKKVEKKVVVKAAGEAEKATAEKEPEPKNSAMFGFGYCTSAGIQLHLEIQKDEIKRTCLMSLPNLFFCIPAALRTQEEKEEKMPAGLNEARFPVKFIREREFIKSPEEKIDLTGTEFLGLVDVGDNPLRR